MGMWPLRGQRADIVFAIAVGVFVLAMTLLSVFLGGGRIDPLGWVLLLSVPVALAVRRRYPLQVALATLAACALYYPLVGAGSPIVLAFVIALFTYAEQGRLSVAVGIAVLAMIGTVIGEFAGPRRHLDDIALFMLTGWLVAAVVGGVMLRNRRAYLREVGRRAATEERLRIARELHDALGHHLSLINVQAGAAVHRIDRTGAPAEFRDTLDAIKSTSRLALTELRGTLGALRRADEDAPLTPAPGLAGLDDLLDRARTAGLVVRGEVDGAVDGAVDGVIAGLPPEVDLAAYRIVQDALTNVARHADARTAVVRIRYGEGEVRVRVEDDGRGAQPGVDGSGIRGMGERARALGGELTAAARPGGGFAVDATLPVGAP